MLAARGLEVLPHGFHIRYSHVNQPLSKAALVRRLVAYRGWKMVNGTIRRDYGRLLRFRNVCEVYAKRMARVWQVKWSGIWGR